MLLTRRRRARFGGRRLAAVVVALCLAMPVFGASAAGAQPATGPEPTLEDIALRDRLIAEQENLLNTYRCLFSADVHLVPGGCLDPDTVTPAAPPPNPTSQDLEVRDQLVADQEALLNVYRCAHSVDLGLVPGGCGDSEPESDSDSGLVDRGDFTAVSSGGSHSCALEGDGRIVCWGDNSEGQALSPQGRFVAVSSSSNRSCAIGVEGGIACWGSFDSESISPSGEEASPPEGQFTAVSASGRYTCALDLDAQVHCWGFKETFFADTWDYWKPFEGRFAAIAAGTDSVCAIGVDGEIVCNSPSIGFVIGGWLPPEGRFVSISGGGRDMCAVDVSGRIECWGRYLGRVSPPEGQFTYVAVGGGNACALDVEGKAVCWRHEREIGDGGGWNEYSVVTVVTPPGEHFVDSSMDTEGRFTAVSDGDARSCGLSTDGRVFCWGGLFRPDYIFPPESGVLRWLYTSSGKHHVCLHIPGRDLLMQDVCWGADYPATPSG